MNYYIYAKDQENVLLFENVVNMVVDREDSVYYSTESSRSHKELEAVKQTCNYSDGIIIYKLSALGATDTEIDAQLEWFIRQSIRLIICTIPSTYQYGIGQPGIRQCLLQSDSRYMEQVVCHFGNTDDRMPGERRLHFRITGNNCTRNGSRKRYRRSSLWKVQD